MRQLRQLIRSLSALRGLGSASSTAEQSAGKALAEGLKTGEGVGGNQRLCRRLGASPSARGGNRPQARPAWTALPAGLADGGAQLAGPAALQAAVLQRSTPNLGAGATAAALWRLQPLPYVMDPASQLGMQLQSLAGLPVGLPMEPAIEGEPVVWRADSVMRKRKRKMVGVWGRRGLARDKTGREVGGELGVPWSFCCRAAVLGSVQYCTAMLVQGQIAPLSDAARRTSTSTASG